MNTLYLTGQMRSGTTLISNFLGGQPRIKMFVDQLRIKTAYVHAFGEEPADWHRPLNDSEREMLFRAFINVTLWIARDHPNGTAIGLKRVAPFETFLVDIQSPDYRPHIKKGSVKSLPDFVSAADFHRAALEVIVGAEGIARLRMAGNKETGGETLAKAISDGGSKAILVIRDPRAVVASLIEKIRRNDTAEVKFNVKSDVPQAIERWLHCYATFAHSTNAHLVKYEDFILERTATVQRMAAYLDCDLQPELVVQTNNSSFDDIPKGQMSKQAISRWRTTADANLIAAVNERCEDQIKALGYNI
jgi:hypothetical protein